MNTNCIIKISIISLITAMLIVPNSVQAQKRKEIKNAGIRSKKEWCYTYSNDTEKKYLQAEYEYDKNGNILLEKSYDENSNIITHKEYKYDVKGREILKITYNPKGQAIEREETTYKNDQKQEKKVFGPNDKLKSKKVFDYKTF
ncbi:MAG: hypothetical protein AB7S48_13080 [Bacteroidales bacterium]